MTSIIPLLYGQNSKNNEFSRAIMQLVDFLGDVTKKFLFKIPIGVNFDITCNCNLRCEHCYYWQSLSSLNQIKNELTYSYYYIYFN